jgi:hypothetical protein
LSIKFNLKNKLSMKFKTKFQKLKRLSSKSEAKL